MSGNIISCGCVVNRQRKLSGTPEYTSYRSMMARCFDPSNSKYHRYGGRGITVCERWKNSFLDFYEDMGIRPTPKHSLDRIDNGGNYEPGNCRWATWSQQVNNRSSNIVISYRGKTQTAIQWSRELGIKHDLICRRVKSGLTDPEQILSPHKVPYGPIRYDRPYAERKQAKLRREAVAGAAF
jgi:hypothetical protein